MEAECGGAARRFAYLRYEASSVYHVVALTLLLLVDTLKYCLRGHDAAFTYCRIHLCDTSRT